MTSIEILERNVGKPNQNEAAACVLTRAIKHITDADAHIWIGFCITDLMRGQFNPLGRPE
jgi:hypothetical protein